MIVELIPWWVKELTAQEDWLPTIVIEGDLVVLGLIQQDDSDPPLSEPFERALYDHDPDVCWARLLRDYAVRRRTH